MDLKREREVSIMKRFALLLICIAWLMPVGSVLAAKQNVGEDNNLLRVELVIFWEPGCLYCKRAKAFLKDQQGTRNWLNIREYDVSASAAAADLFQRSNELFDIKRPGVPLIVAGGRQFLGFDEAGITGAAILDVATACRQNACPTLTGILSKRGDTAAGRTVRQRGAISDNINVPFW